MVLVISRCGLLKVFFFFNFVGVVSLKHIFFDNKKTI